MAMTAMIQGVTEEDECPLLASEGTDVEIYTQHFKELALLCGRMFPEESDKVEKYVAGLPDMIQGSVMASKPKKMQDAIEFATELMDQKICIMWRARTAEIRSLADRQAENKRKLDDTSRNNQNQQQPFKRHKMARSYTGGPGEKKVYGRSKPLCPRNGNVVARAYVVGMAGTNLNSNVITGSFLLNNRYASILFDTGVDRSFASTAFGSLFDVVPTTLDYGYDVELVD
ncbi:hypothetical protein Tco_0828474, partial [Tanacetum coccineum]